MEDKDRSAVVSSRILPDCGKYSGSKYARFHARNTRNETSISGFVVDSANPSWECCCDITDSEENPGGLADIYDLAAIGKNFGEKSD